ncbi:LysR family transcriptional regulator [Gordonia humi]|uniref:DNA-binding transcriptional LysR family regulator n=1 Tax=Gordonia humi TaxID=686429 RepID=A0A840EZS6_9ACTN|nr:LysR family transcriptional regulator [Gordonia humi]MBB4135854.1 DNA-binding transcriptional LysR family regulator [Gordonia humi]
MEFRQLSQFLVVADEGHFTRASRRLHMSQSALSSSIRTLESELGVALFERTTRRVLLTPAGSLLLRHARTITAEVSAAQQAVADLRGLGSGTLDVGTVQTFTSIDLPRALADYHADHPGVQISVREATTVELLDAVRGGGLDAAFVALDHRPVGQGVHVLHTYTEPLCAVVGPDHRLATADGVGLAELAAWPFIDFEAGVGLQTVVAALFDAASIDRDIAFRIGDMTRLLRLVEHGLGVAVVPESIVHDAAVVALAITGSVTPTRHTALVCRESVPSNPAARRFVESLGGGSKHPILTDDR